MEPENLSYKVSRACSETYLTIVSKSTIVRDMQDELFPHTPRKTRSANSFYYADNIYGRRSLDNNGTESPEDRVTSWFLKYKENRDRDFEYDGQQQARWPSECQVLDERVKHIPYKTCPPEPYYHPTGREIQTRPVGEEAGIIIYQYYPISSVDYFSRSSVGGSKYLLQTCPSPDEEGLRFESRFESGNLAKAIKIHDTYYELYLRNDLYTNRHMQWFYFRVTGMKKGPVYRFSIVNFTKSENLYADGMKPLMYSNKDAQMHSVGWRRVGNNIAYFSNENNNDDHPELPTFHTLTFTFDFPHDDDTVYFAHSYPYTYTDLQEYLFGIVAHPVKASYTTLRLLCKTLAGNNVYYVTVTTPPHECNPNKKKKAVVITARVHPGETPASWMMHGILEYLTSDCGPAKELRDNFIFKLVPMLNPDGVIVGNHRCSLTGRDLNRQYRTVIREYYPTIWYTKLMIRKLVEECGVAMYCDLHAHSKRNNIFIFGCENRKNPDRKLYEQVFPLMLHKNAPEKFSFQTCKFRVQKCKEGTGRVVMWMMGIANSFTLEASFGGSTLGGRFETHFNTLDFEMMGKTFCQTLLDFYDEDPRKEKLRLKIMSKLMHEGSNADEPANIDISDYSSDDGDSSSSTDCNKEILAEAVPTNAPPPTPEKKRTPKVQKSQTLLATIPPPPAKPAPVASQRKPLRVRRANLDLMNWKVDGSDDSSASETSEIVPKNKKLTKKMKKKKKKVRKISVVNQATQNVAATSEFKVNDVLPEKLMCKPIKKPATMLQPIQQHRFVGDTGYNPQMVKLIEIQNKLITLKNKLWFGVGDMDPQNPLSWGLKTDYRQESVIVTTQKAEKRKVMPKKSKPQVEKLKEEARGEKSIKKPKEANVQRQSTIEQQLQKALRPRKTPTFRVIKVNFDAKLPLEIAQRSSAKAVAIKKKQKKKPSKTATKLKLLPND